LKDVSLLGIAIQSHRSIILQFIQLILRFSVFFQLFYMISQQNPI